jgi:glyoxylase-like metal-dependent hydrolase (beta-lactamase superfamily II)
MPAHPTVRSFFDAITGTFTHVVFDIRGGHAAVIDPVLDFDPRNGRTSHESINGVINFIQQQGLTLEWILETHAHADHLTAAPYLQSRLGGRIAMGKRIQQVQSTFKVLFNLEPAFATDGSQFDHLFEESDRFQIGSLTGFAWHVPGHTPADMAYLIGDAVFVGDTLFPPDVGTARCDFPGGDAHQLYHSIQRLLALPGCTRLFMCHDYPPTKREPIAACTVEEQRTGNAHLQNGVTEADFVSQRQARDDTLPAPNLLIPSIQINIRAGRLPAAEANGQYYLKIPVDVL